MTVHNLKKLTDRILKTNHADELDRDDLEKICKIAEKLYEALQMYNTENDHRQIILTGDTVHFIEQPAYKILQEINRFLDDK